MWLHEKLFSNAGIASDAIVAGTRLQDSEHREYTS
jgi:hypothetical protein